MFRAKGLWLLPSLLLITPAFAAECETNFKKSGNLITGTSFSTQIVVDDLSARDALGQVRGIMTAEKFDVIAENADEGTLLLEQRSSTMARPVPITVQVDAQGKAAQIAMTVQVAKGAFAKADAVKAEVCKYLAQVRGGKEGRAAGARGAKAQNSAEATAKTAFAFSREIADESKANALAVNARHRGRNYTLRGRIAHIMEDGQDYNVVFDITPVSEMPIKPLPHQAQYNVGVSCLFRPNQLTTVLALKKGQNVTLSGSFMRYDDIKRVAWLENCRQVRK